MSAIEREARRMGRRIAGSPEAIFLAVLTAGLAISSTLTRPGVAHAGPAATRAAKSQPASGASCRHAEAAPTKQAEPAKTAPGQTTATETRSSPGQARSVAGTRAEASAAAAESSAAGAPCDSTRQTASGGGRGFALSLPDFNAPELSKFTSPF
jgi:hypothetical protein